MQAARICQRKACIFLTEILQANEGYIGIASAGPLLGQYWHVYLQGKI